MSDGLCDSAALVVRDLPLNAPCALLVTLSGHCATLMVERRCKCILLPLLLMLSLRCVSAASILSISSPGARSHQMNLLRIGRELAQRGHAFDVLISRDDVILQSLLKSRLRWFDGLTVIKYDGPPGIGTEAWGSSLSRDPIVVRTSHCLAMFCTSVLNLLSSKKV